MVYSANISASMQDYLEAIIELADKEGSVRVTDIANKMSIAKASVNQIVHKLKDMGLVKHQTYGPIMLTKNGREVAEKIRQRHLKIKKFLIEVLGVDKKIADIDACLMEHAVSAHTMEKLTYFLCEKGFLEDSSCIGKEKRSIKREGTEEEQQLRIENVRTLNSLHIGQKGKVVRIASKGLLKKRIMEMGITSGTEIELKGFAPLGDPVEIELKGYHLSIRKEEASDIFVEVK